MRFQLAVVVLASACVNMDGGGSFGGGGDDDSGGAGSGSSVGDCPGGPTCSPKTPNGLDFSGAAPTYNAFPPGADTLHNHIAAGGTDVIQLRDGGAPFDLPYTASVDDPAALAIASSSSSTVTLRGLGGTTELDIVDPSTGLLFDRYAYASSALVTAAVVPGGATAEMVYDDVDAYAFMPGDLALGVAFVDAQVPAHRLVDTSATLALAGATQTDWDTLSLAGATVGSYSITVATGATTATATLDVVDHVDSVARIDSVFGDVVCFGADTAGSFVVGLAWSFVFDGQPVDASIFGTNCIDLPDSVAHTVTATAGGKSVTVQVIAQ
jgi:hypothetical protein